MPYGYNGIPPGFGEGPKKKKKVPAVPEPGPIADKDDTEYDDTFDYRKGSSRPKVQASQLAPLPNPGDPYGAKLKYDPEQRKMGKQLEANVKPKYKAKY